MARGYIKPEGLSILDRLICMIWKRKVIHIEWDVDDEKQLEDLPTEIEIPNEITDEDEISDYISDETGFCHKGFVLDYEE